MTERICFVCREKHEKNKLVRVYRVKGEDGNFSFHIGNGDGRGCHICPTCIEKAKKSRALNRSFRMNVPQEIYDKLVSE